MREAKNEEMAKTTTKKKERKLNEEGKTIFHVSRARPDSQTVPVHVANCSHKHACTQKC